MKSIINTSTTLAPIQTWHWRTWAGLPYLQCDLLEDWPHGFFTQPFWPRSPIDLIEVLDVSAQMYRVRQVHGNTVLTTAEVERYVNLNSGDEETEVSQPFPPADGLLTQQGGQAIWVCSADCTPALVADVQTGQVAAVHAGWRGTAAKILPQAIARLQQQGSQLVNLRIALGPAIAGEVYQVSAEVATHVGSTVVPPKIASEPEDVLEHLQQLEYPPVLTDSEPGRVRLDVRRINALQLEHLGIQPEQVAIAPQCTYQQPDIFFSYRRDGLKKVQWSGIVSQ
jgi:YfiH family protein